MEKVRVKKDALCTGVVVLGESTTLPRTLLRYESRPLLRLEGLGNHSLRTSRLGRVLSLLNGLEDLLAPAEPLETQDLEGPLCSVCLQISTEKGVY